MNFDLPPELTDHLARLDAFIEAEIRPLEHANDNIRFLQMRKVAGFLFGYMGPRMGPRRAQFAGKSTHITKDALA